MPAKIYRIKLTEEERQELEALCRKGKAAARKIIRARALLLCDENHGAGKDDQVAQATGLSPLTVSRLRRRCCEVGPLGALERKPRDTPPIARKLDGHAEARLIAEACSAPPAGASRWTLKLLAGRLVKLEICESISPETVRKTLKKTNSGPI